MSRRKRDAAAAPAAEEQTPGRRPRRAALPDAQQPARPAEDAQDSKEKAANAPDDSPPSSRTRRSLAAKAASAAGTPSASSPAEAPAQPASQAGKRKRRGAGPAPEPAPEPEHSDSPPPAKRTRMGGSGKDKADKDRPPPESPTLSGRAGKSPRSRSKSSLGSPKSGPLSPRAQAAVASADEDMALPPPAPKGRRRDSRSRKGDEDGPGSPPPSVGRRKKKQDEPPDALGSDGEEAAKPDTPASNGASPSSSSNPNPPNPASNSNSNPPTPAGLPPAASASAQLAAMFGLGSLRPSTGSGSGSGSGRFASLLSQLRRRDDPTAQMVALQELSEVLSVATEDMFGRGGYGGGGMAGFDVDAWVRELLSVLRGPDRKDPKEALRAAGIADDFPLEFLDADTLAELGLSAPSSAIAPDLMLLALRCLSNLIEALPSATALVVGAEGVPALVAKLREIEYIDLAESVLSVLGKVAGEYPLAVLRAGGVAAALGYVDFFALSTQRVAVGIAAAALRGLGQQAGAEDMAREAMPTLERLLGYGDARLVEGVVKAIAKVVEWACRPQAGESEKAVEDRVESLIQSSLLRAIMDLLSPNVPTQTVVTPQLFTSLLRLLPPVLRASPRYAHMMAAEWGLADLVRSVLCGPEPADAADEVADAEDANAGTAERVMRTIATRTEEQVIEALSVATDAIAALPKGDIWALRVPAGQGDEKAKPPRASTSESQASDVAMEGAEAPAASSESKPEGEDPADGGDGEEDGDGEGDDGEEDEEDDDEPPSPTTTTGPSFTERNAKLAELHRADKDSLVNFCGSLLPVVLEVHAATVQPQIRRKCVGLIARMVWFCGEIAGEDGLRIVLARAKGFGGFVTSLVVQGREGVYGAAIDANAPPSVAAAAAASEANKKAEQLGVLASGLQLALLVLERCPDPYLRAFVREGVLHEVEKTAQVATAWLEEHQQAAADAAASAEASKDAAGDVVMADADGGSGSNSGPRRSKRNKGKESEPASGSASAAASPKPASAAKPSSAPQPTSSSSSSAEPGSTASLLSGMRKMLERLSDVMGHSGTDLGAVAASAGIPGLAPPPPRTGSAPMVQNISGERFADKDVREWLVWMCSRILAFYSDVSTKSSGEVGSVLRELKALSKKLKAAAAMSEGGSDPADIASLHRVAELLAGVGVGGDGKGATSFEVLRSGIVEGLVQYLSALPLADSKSAAAMSPEDARAQHLRIKAFVHVFMNGPWPYPGDRELTVVSVPHEDPRGDSDRRHQHGPGPQPLRSSHDHTEPQMYVPNALMSLVRRLQSLLSRTEHFEVVAAIPGQQSSALASYALESIMGASYLAASQNPAMQLTRQLRLRLVAEEPDNVPKTFNNYAVSIHAVATFRALEEYLKGRVGGLDFGSTPGQGDGTVASTGNPAASNASAAAADAAASPSAVVPSGGDDKASGAGDGDVEMDQGEDGEDDEDGEDGDDGDDGEDGEDDEDEDEDEDGEEEGAPGEAPSGGEGEEAGASGDYDDGEDDYDDGDYDDGQMVDVSDLLLHSEEESRRRRVKPKRVDSTGSSIGGAAAGSLGTGAEPPPLDRQRTGDSFVVDIGDKEDQGPLTPQRTLRSRSGQTPASSTSAPSPLSAASKPPAGAAALPPPSPTTRPAASSSAAPPPASSSAPAALGASAGAAAPVPSYSSVVAGTANSFHIEFSIGDAVSGVFVPVTSDMTIFAACWQLEQEQARRRAAPGAAPPASVNVWNSAYTVRFRKVGGARPVAAPPTATGSEPSKKPPPSPAREVAPQSPAASVSTTAVDHLLIPRLPFDSVSQPAIDATSPAGRILYLLRALYGINTNWTDVYLDENSKVMELSHAKELLDSQPLEEEAMVIESEEMVQNRLEPVPARSDIELHPGVIAALPPSAFVNSKVTAKLARQLDEPLIVAGRVVPDWCSAIARHFSFLVSFESRWTFLQSTSFGYSRSMLRWQQQQQQQASSSGSAAAAREQQVLGRIQRQKVRISRNRVLESMIKVMELYGSSQALLEVEFFEEVGTGLGPTLEFYTLVCTEIQKAKLKLWRDESTEPQPAKGSRRKSKPGADSDRYVVAPHGLFPAPMNAAVAASDNGKRLLNLFRNLGTFVAKSLLDARMVDIPFNNVFLRLILKGCFSMASASDEDAARDSEQQRVRGLHYLKHIDPALTQSLLHLQKYVHQKRAIESRRDLSADEILDQINAIKVDGAHVEDLCLDFSLPGYPDIELLRNGKNISVTIFNIEEYVAAVIEATLGDGVRRQVEAFRSGFDVVFPVTDLNAFTLEELGMLLGGGQQEDWSAEGLTDAIKADHGYRTDSIAIRNLIEILSEFTSLERREFLQFVTGSPKLPLGGFRNLSPPLTVVCKTCEAPHQPDDYLPSVMTCVNYLKMPDYSAKAVMKAKLLLAMSEGKGAFHLS